MQDGLPSDIIKGVQQDHLGYLWTATDEGVAKYDGIEFRTYPEIANSNYMKGFLLTENGRQILFGDLDVYEIKNEGDTTIFNALSPASRVLSDTAVNYPKAIYEGNDNTLWISEPQSVVRLNEGQLKRFDFGAENRTTQFLRSFSLFEDIKGSLYACSFQGNVFKYNSESEGFDQVENITFPESVEFAKVFGEQLIIGAAEGLFISKLTQSSGFEKPILKKSIPEVSYIERISSDRFLVASRGKEHFISDLDFYNFEPLDIAINNINHVYVSDEKDIWISCNDGLILMRENLFRRVGDLNTFVETVTESQNTDSVYYASNLSMYVYDKSSDKSLEVPLHFPDGYHQSLLHTDQGLWVANAFNVYLYKKNSLVKEYDFSYQPRFASELTLDKAGNIWVTVINDKSAHKIDRNLEIENFEVPLGELGVINNIHEGPDGMYVASSGNDSYLFHKPEGSSEFRNISIPMQSKAGLEITSLAFHRDDIYLASSIGLLKYNREGIESIDLGPKFSNLPIRALAKYGENELLFSNAFGLARYDLLSGVVDLFNESYGLPSRSISPNGITVGRDLDVWVGTSKGLCYSPRPLSRNTRTKTPIIVDRNVNGESLSANEFVAAFGSLITFTISAITFPEKDVNYQYRINEDQTWINCSNEIIFSQLPSGNQTLEVRAKKHGPYSWSETTKIKFSVSAPYWRKPLFIVGVVALALVFVFVIYSVVDYQNRQNQLRLKALIDEKTSALKAANDDLEKSNEEKKHLMEIVAHDLKSPLAQIIGLVDLMKTDKKFASSDDSLDMITTSTSNLTEMISKILDVRKVEANEINVKFESVNISALLNQTIDQYVPRSASKQIQISREIEDDVYASVDMGYLRQIFENLISNALKFSQTKSTVIIRLVTSNDRAICEIKDEGPGLTADDRKKLFTKFKKLSARPTGGESSTGLGLSIAKRFVSLMNGEIWVESKEGQGASFFVAFAQIKKSSET